MKLFKRVLKNTFYLTVSQVVNKLLFLLLMVVLARKLGVGGTGNYAFVIAFMNTVFPFTELGLINLSIRTIARDKSKARLLVGNIILVRTLAFFIVFAMSLAYIIFYAPAELRSSLVIGLLVVLCSVLTSSFNAVFRAFEKMHYEATVEIVQWIVTVGLGILILFAGGGLVGLLCSFFLGSLAALAVSLSITLKKFCKPIFVADFNLWKNLLKEGFYFWVAMLGSLLYFNTDTLLLYVLKGSEATGIYKAGYTIIKNVEIIPQLFVLSLYPQLSLLWAKSKKRMVPIYRKALLYMAFMGALLLVALILLARPLILILFGRDFLASVTVLKVLSMGIFFFLINSVNSSYLFAMDEQKVNALIVASGIFLNIILHLILIPRYSFYGAAFATVTTLFVVFVVRQSYILRVNRRLSA